MPACRVATRRPRQDTPVVLRPHTKPSMFEQVCDLPSQTTSAHYPVTVHIVDASVICASTTDWVLTARRVCIGPLLHPCWFVNELPKPGTQRFYCDRLGELLLSGMSQLKRVGLSRMSFQPSPASSSYPPGRLRQMMNTDVIPTD